MHAVCKIVIDLKTEPGWDKTKLSTKLRSRKPHKKSSCAKQNESYTTEDAYLIVRGLWVEIHRRAPSVQLGCKGTQKLFGSMRYAGFPSKAGKWAGFRVNHTHQKLDRHTQRVIFPANSA